MAEQSSIAGTLVAAFARPYDFMDRDTQERKVGTTRKLFVVANFDGEPMEVRVDSEELWAQVSAAAQWSSVSCVCELSARANKITRKLVGFRVDRAPTKAA